MGQQQLLLIVLGILIVGSAILIGIALFRAHGVEAKRNNVTGELINLAALAQQYYLKPTALGGGNRVFTGWRIPNELVITANGHYTATVFSDSVELIGTGNEVVTGNDSIKVKLTVSPTNYQTVIIN